MNKYAQISRKAVDQCRCGAAPTEAWAKAALAIFPEQKASRKKGCPRSAFLGLVENGMIKGVAGENLLRSSVNKDHAIEAVYLLRARPALAQDAGALWRQVTKGTHKQHNQQMNVVISLWERGDLLT